MGPGDMMAAKGVLLFYGPPAIINPGPFEDLTRIAITRQAIPAAGGGLRPSEKPIFEGRMLVGEVERVNLKVGTRIVSEGSDYDVAGIDPAPGGGLQIIKLARR
jgi:hypothetical protein